MNNSSTTLPPPLLRLAFRPFFLGGAIFSCLAMLWWAYFWFTPFNWQPYGGAIWWHGHEMIFGFGVAIVVGFLLTAVQNWTGVPGLRGAPLATLFIIWLVGRLLIAFAGDINNMIIAAADTAFLIAAAVAMAYPVIKAKQWRNIMFVPIFLVLASLNAASHWAANNDQPLLALRTLHSAIMMITLIITIIGGRVIPMFTANGTSTQKVLPIKSLELVSLFSIVLIVLTMMAGYPAGSSPWLIPLYAVATIASSWRFLRWRFWITWRVPLLWSLHLSYAFIPLGLFAMLLVCLGLWPNYSAALHFFSAGAIGGVVLAMISRVTLGHTGYPLQAPSPMALAFILILLAGVVRVLMPITFSVWASISISFAAALWAVAYGIFIWRYASKLCQPRIDGQPG
jgi:uncharacterized protein involved in response to NO